MFFLADKLKSFLSKDSNVDLLRVTRYLIRYGYLQNVATNLDEIANAIRKFRSMAGLSETNVIDDKMARVMEAPRCAMMDNIVEEANNLPKWAMKELRYCITGYDQEISKEEWEESIAVALGYISNVCDLTFIKVNNTSDANLVYGIGKGSKDDFDGASGTLAWFQLPSSSMFKGQVIGKFDVDETWIPVSKTGRGIRLVNVACHETCHGLGVSHVNVQNSLMNPYYSESIDKPQAEDIRQLNTLRYGPPKNTPTPTPTPTPTTNTVITITGKVDRIEIPGFRVQKLS